MYTLTMAKNDLKQEWIKGFSITRIGKEWVLEVNQGTADSITRCICTARGEIRRFKTTEAAIKTAEQIGFKVHTLRLEII